MEEDKDFQTLISEMRKYFPETKIEDATMKPPYVTRTVTIEEMDDAIEDAVFEANAWMFEGKIMNEGLPEGWIALKLGDVIEYGKTHKVEPFELNENIWVLELEDIEKDSSKLLNRLTYKDRGSKSTKNKFKKGDVLYGKLRPYLNKLLIADTDGVCTTEILPIPQSAYLSNIFIFYWLKYSVFTEYVASVVYGLNMPRLGTKEGLNAPFLLPPLAEQQEIATRLEDVLAQVDTIKVRLDAIPAILKRFRQSVLAAAVSGKLTEDVNQKDLKSWSYTALGELIAASPQNGIYKPSSSYGHGVKIFRIDSFYDGYVTHWSNLKRLALSQDELNTWGIKNLDILINRVNSIEYLGKCALVTELPEDAVFESNIIRITLNTTIANPYYIRIFLISLIGIERLRKNAKLAVNQASINQQDVKNCLINLPPLPEQTEIVNRVEQLFTFATQIEQQVQAAQTRVNNLTQAILAKAFKGELTADWRAANPELISGENSAQALLEKIKASQTPAKTKRGKATQTDLFAKN